MSEDEVRVAPKGELEVDDGCLVWRDGPLSITICAENVTLYNNESGNPAVKVPLTQADVFRALDEISP